MTPTFAFNLPSFASPLILTSASSLMLASASSLVSTSVSSLVLILTSSLAPISLASDLYIIILQLSLIKSTSAFIKLNKKGKKPFKKKNIS